MKGDCKHLDIEEYTHWYNAIINNDRNAFCQILQSSDQYQKNLLLHGHFDFGDKKISQATKGQSFQVALPLAIAAAVGASDAFTALIDAGVCPKKSDCNGNNVIHSLIAFLHFNPEQEKTIVTNLKLFISSVDIEIIREILCDENSFGLRPIEFAAQHGQVDVVLLLMDTEGIYLEKKTTCGLTNYQWYDITEYEKPGTNCRLPKSPLVLLTNMDKSNVLGEQFTLLTNSVIFTQWFDKKFLINLPLILIWFILRLIFVSFFIIVDFDVSLYKSQNASICYGDVSLDLSNRQKIPLYSVLIVQAIIGIIVDVVETIQMFGKQYRPIYCTLSGKKRRMTQDAMYRYSHFLLCLCFIVILPLIFTRTQADPLFLDGTRILTPFFAIWCLLYFIQLIPSIGFFIFSIYRMVSSLVHLSFVYGLFLIPFTQCFYNFVNNNTLEGCIDHFEGLFNVFYSLFMIMLNMIDLTQFKIHNIELLYCMHMLYTFLVTIMLINFFIAVMSNSMSLVNQNKQGILRIQRLSVAILVEKRMRKIIPFYYDYMIKYFFTTQGDKILLLQSTTKIPSLEKSST